MQITTLRTISPQIQASLASSDFSALARNSDLKTKSASLQPFTNFRGRISVGDVFFPMQMFSMREEGKHIYIQNHPEKAFPRMEIVLEERALQFQIKEFKIEPSSNSVEAEVYYTRLFFLFNEEKKCSLHIQDIDVPSFDFSLVEISSEVKKQVLFNAKLYRKLKFIEEFFNIEFNLPKELPVQEIRRIEILFRAITEGEFSIPAGNSMSIFNYKISKEDLQNLSVAQKKAFSFEFNEGLLVLGKFFPIGKMTFKAEKASIANPNSLRNYAEGNMLETLKLNIFDNQVYYRFEKYADSAKLLKNRQKLERFKNLLRKEEPDFLVELIDKPLAEVNAKFAAQIIEGLLQYYDFPDRFSVLKPTLETNRWRVPIALTYPKREPIWLEDAFVDVRTGKVEMKISFDQLLRKGKKKAKEAFSVE